MDIFDLLKNKIYPADANAGPVEYIIVGLGNPDSKYLNTRHNAGFLAVDRIAEKASVEVNRLKYKAQTNTVTIEGKRVLLMDCDMRNSAAEQLLQLKTFRLLKKTSKTK